VDKQRFQTAQMAMVTALHGFKRLPVLTGTNSGRDTNPRLAHTQEDKADRPRQQGTLMAYSAEYQRNRATLMELKLPCHWCGTEWTKKFQADHLIEKDAGGDDSPSNLVSSCAPCNQKRGQRYQTNKTNARITARNKAIQAKPFFDEPFLTDRKSVV
jgi:5-methylcytosine-specific restriction endonuclease McrA